MRRIIFIHIIILSFLSGFISCLSMEPEEKPFYSIGKDTLFYYDKDARYQVGKYPKLIKGSFVDNDWIFITDSQKTSNRSIASYILQYKRVGNVIYTISEKEFSPNKHNISRYTLFSYKTGKLIYLNDINDIPSEDKQIFSYLELLLARGKKIKVSDFWGNAHNGSSREPNDEW